MSALLLVNPQQNAENSSHLVDETITQAMMPHEKFCWQENCHYWRPCLFARYVTVYLTQPFGIVHHFSWQLSKRNKIISSITQTCPIARKTKNYLLKLAVCAKSMVQLLSNGIQSFQNALKLRVLIFHKKLSVRSSFLVTIRSVMSFFTSWWVLLFCLSLSYTTFSSLQNCSSTWQRCIRRI